MSGCTCERYRIVAPNGSLLEGELRRDPDCREHGFPSDKWPAEHPLRRHARWIRCTVFQPAFLDCDGRVVLPESEFVSRPRVETPREVEARLLHELSVLVGTREQR